MQYWTVVTRSFGIAWRHKYLWLVAFFAGESGSGFSGNSGYQSSLPRGQNGGGPDFNSAYNSATSWLNDHIGLIVFFAVLILVIWIALFVLAAVCEGATVRAAAEYDAERPFGLGWAWQAGRASMGTIIRIRLLLLVLGLPAAILLIAVLGGFVVAIVNGNAGAAVLLGLFGAFLGLGGIVYFIYLDVLGRLSARAAVLEQVTSARAAMSRGHGLVRKRLGRVVLVWLLALVVGFVVGIGVAIALAIVAIPLIIAGVAAAATGSGAVVVVILFGIVIFLPIAFLIGGFLSAQSSTFWTLAFRRLEIDAAPAGYPYAYPAPPPA
ncbi:MAG: hypothetical protein ACHQ0J_10995 [Candidatus Dormibacterales bacterium]